MSEEWEKKAMNSSDPTDEAALDVRSESIDECSSHRTGAGCDPVSSACVDTTRL